MKNLFLFLKNKVMNLFSMKEYLKNHNDIFSAYIILFAIFLFFIYLVYANNEDYKYRIKNIRNLQVEYTQADPKLKDHLRIMILHLTLDENLRPKEDYPKDIQDFISELKKQ